MGVSPTYIRRFGTACYGLTKALLKCGVDLIFVVPKAFGDEEPGKIRLVNASDVAVNLQDEIFSNYIDKISFVEVDSSLFHMPMMNNIIILWKIRKWTTI
jgi:hypothetical protein